MANIIFKKVVIYFTIFFLFSLSYLLLFRTGIFYGNKVLFYRGILLLVLNMSIFILIFLFINKLFHGRFNLETFSAALVMSFSINLSLFIVFPVTFDRSITMYLLQTLENKNVQSCQGLSKEDLQSNLINEYVIKNGAVQRRIMEQSVIGTLKNNDVCIQLTERGKDFLNFSKTVKQIYGIN